MECKQQHIGTRLQAGKTAHPLQSIHVLCAMNFLLPDNPSEEPAQVAPPPNPAAATSQQEAHLLGRQ